jgi:hypothetical protein
MHLAKPHTDLLDDLPESPSRGSRDGLSHRSQCRYRQLDRENVGRQSRQAIGLIDHAQSERGLPAVSHSHKHAVPPQHASGQHGVCDYNNVGFSRPRHVGAEGLGIMTRAVQETDICLLNTRRQRTVAVRPGPDGAIARFIPGHGV